MIVRADLRATVTAWAGEAGAAWLASLPSLVADLAAEWGLTVGEPYVPSGYTALAVRVARADGTPAVLKVAVPDEWSAGEAIALRHYGGHAAVRLYEWDQARYALLLERCTPGTPLTSRPDEDCVRVVADLLAELWSPPPPECGLLRIADVVPRWRASVTATTAVEARLRDETVEVLDWLCAPSRTRCCCTPTCTPGTCSPPSGVPGSRSTRRARWATVRSTPPRSSATGPRRS